jgi:hypothetical protein
MSKLGFLFAVAFIAALASARADEQVWVMDNWPADISQIPCGAWTKNSDGTWVLTGGAVKLGSETVNNIGVKGDAAAHLLDRQCGAKKK